MPRKSRSTSFHRKTRHEIDPRPLLFGLLLAASGFRLRRKQPPAPAPDPAQQKPPDEQLKDSQKREQEPEVQRERGEEGAEGGGQGSAQEIWPRRRRSGTSTTRPALDRRADRRHRGHLDDRRRQPGRQGDRRSTCWATSTRCPIAGGEAKALTHDIAWDMQPRYSPGRQADRLHHRRGGGDNIWVMNADGIERRRRSRKEDFRLLNSPPGRRTASTSRRASTSPARARSASGEIWLYHRSGGGGRAADREAELAEGHSASPPSRPTAATSTSRRTPRRARQFEYNKDSNGEIFDIQRLDLHDGEHRALRHRAGRRGPPDALAGRQVARLRAPRAQPERRCS